MLKKPRLDPSPLTCKAHPLAAHEAPVLLGFGGFPFSFFTARGDNRSRARSSRLAYNYIRKENRGEKRVFLQQPLSGILYLQQRQMSFIHSFYKNDQCYMAKLPPSVLRRKRCTALRKPLAGSIRSALWHGGIFKTCLFLDLPLFLGGCK